MIEKLQSPDQFARCSAWLEVACEWSCKLKGHPHVYGVVTSALGAAQLYLKDHERDAISVSRFLHHPDESSDLGVLSTTIDEDDPAFDAMVMVTTSLALVSILAHTAQGSLERLPEAAQDDDECREFSLAAYNRLVSQSS